MAFLSTIWESLATWHVGSHPQDPVLARMFTSPVHSGVEVNEDTALNFSAVWAAVRLISETMATLPFSAFRRLSNGGKEKNPRHPAHRLLHDQPNPEMTATVFRETLQAHVLTLGKGLAEIERDGGNRPIALWPITPDRVTIDRDKSGTLIYDIAQGEHGQARTLRTDQVLHIPGLGFDGVESYSVINRARESIGVGMAAEKHGALFFGNNSVPPVAIKHPAQLSDGAFKRIQGSWNLGPNQTVGRVKILEEGMDIKQLSMPNEDAQWLESRKFAVAEIARWFRAPPHLLGDLEKATFSNIEQQEIEFVVHTIRPWCVRWEQECNRKLLRVDQRSTHFFEHTVDGLLRGDSVSRAQSLQTQFQNGALNIDEWRSIENRNPLPDGNGQKHFVPLNMTTVEKAGVDEPEPEERQPDVEDKEDEQRQSQVLDAARHVISELMGRCVRRECKALRIAGENPSRFLAWLDDFYPKHLQLIEQTLEPGFRLVGTLDRSGDFSAAEYVRQSREELLDVAGQVSAKQFRCAIDELATLWESSRADQFAREVIPCQN